MYNIVATLQSHRLESHRSLYLQVYCARQYWQQEANTVWYAWLRQNDTLVQRYVGFPYLKSTGSMATDECNRLKAQGSLGPFLNADGTLRTR